jgi:translation initiation factor 2 subunit 2
MNFTTEQLLDRAYDKLQKIQKEENKQKKSFIKPEIVNHNRKSYITNFTKFCASINRDLESVKKFINKDMNAEVSLMGDNNMDDETSGLKFNMTYKSSQIMNCITNYMKTYVLCELCKSGNTEILKIDRINYISCNSCKSQKAI